MSDFSPIEDAIKAVQKGQMIIIVDNPNRENEGDFFFPAELVTPEKVNFILREARGIVCVALEQSQAHKLGLASMVPLLRNTESTKVNFTVSVNAKENIRSGVSAQDRAQTIRVLAGPESSEQAITKPGHVFPLIAHPKGLAERQGHTEAAVTIAKLAGFQPAGVICEILNSDGTMANVPELHELAKKHTIKLVSIVDLQSYLEKHPIVQQKQSSVVCTAAADLPTAYGTFKIHVFRSAFDGLEHSALIMGDVEKPMLTRLHSQCVTGDTFSSQLCDCGEQLHASLSAIQKNGNGILLYLNQEGRGIGLTAKIRAYVMQKQGLDTVEANLALGFGADERDYSVAADILEHLGVNDVNLLTNNPDKKSSLENHGITVSKRTPIEIPPNSNNRRYLATKKSKMGHQLDLV